MKSRGFVYKPVPYEAPASAGATWGDEAYAKEHGYGFAFEGVPGDEATADAPASEGAGSESAAYEAALTGKGAGNSSGADNSDMVAVDVGGGATMYYSKSSCRTYGEEQVRGESSQWLQIEARIGELAGEVTHRVDADPRMVDAMHKWASCMSEAGYHVATPEQAAVLVSDQVATGALAPERARAEEIAVASKDASCAHSSGALDIRIAVMRDVEEQVRADNENDILAFQELQQESFKRAQDINGAQ